MILELNIKNQSNSDKYCSLLQQATYLGCSITSKKNNYSLQKTLFELSKIPNLQIVPTFSCKCNYNQNADNTYQEFLQFLKIIEHFDCKQILLVSGNPKMKLDTLETLKKYSGNTKIAIAYNPYVKDIELENQRLIVKLRHPSVNQVWLQLGQDFEKLKIAIKFVRQINPQIEIINSVLLPTKNLLKSLQFRPWSGVFYTDQFYDNLDFAVHNTDQMKSLSKDLGLKVLISGV